MDPITPTVDSGYLVTNAPPGEVQRRQTKRQHFNTRLFQMRNERESWISHWQDLSSYILPRNSRFIEGSVDSSRDRGDKKHNNIINGTATKAARTLCAGMMAGLSSPARPWFRLTTRDPQLAKSENVRAYLNQVEEALRELFLRCRIYRGLFGLYEDLAVPGTAALWVDEDEKTTLRGYNLPIGSYYLANDATGRVDTCYREFSMTVGQLVSKFGLENCSAATQSAWKNDLLDQWRDVVHAVEPNVDYSGPGMMGPKGWKYISVRYEKIAGEQEGFLSESGYHEFPVLAPRWRTTGEDIYGSSPSMDALGDIKSLQMYETRKAELVDKISDPPMRAPTSMIGQRSSLLPGDTVYVDAVNEAQTYAPAIIIRPEAVTVVEDSIAKHEQRIKGHYFADLWLSVTESSDSDKTAREIAEMHDEKMMQLGPVVEQMEDEVFDPLITRGYAVLLRGGQLPPPPKELQGKDLRIDYISIMAHAQKLLGTTGIERLASFASELAKVKGDVLDKIDFDEMIDDYADSLGVKPDIVRTDEDAAAIRKSRADAQQAQAQAEQQLTQAQTAQTLATTPTTGPTALNQMLNATSPLAPQVQA